MDLICPDCRALLNVVDAHNATCAGHDGRYQILFDREAGIVPEAPRPALAASPSLIMPSAVTDPSTGMLSLNLTQLPGPRVDNVLCAQHPEIPAVNRCRICSKGICATCDFLLPGNVHVCPSCLEMEPSTEISSQRKAKMVLGLIIAAFDTLLFALLVSGALHRTFGNNEGTNMVIGNLILWSAIAGVVVAMTALDRRLRNSSAIWVGVVWNSINLSLFLILMVIGMARG